MGRIYTLKNSVAFVGLLVSVCCIFVVMLSLLRLPDVSLGGNRAMMGPYKTFSNRKEVVAGDEKLGKYGEMMVQMLPDDLAFTVFVPSERAFERDLGLRSAAADDDDNSSRRNDTYAVVSRVLGFSAVPRALHSSVVAPGDEVSYDSLSGLTLFVSKDSEGTLVVNRIPAERVDIRRKAILVHVMDGVIMDAEFEQSVQPDLDDTTD
ncbi:unnamed protein product [Linum tenue]|uniref:FAS1 domain-containing protein n=1 Tax=Linum tenue TaxID=586396 RepID=A0AAV0JSC8_9ROSI|nr:unnamed protein product [Linum tenue]